MKLTLFEAVKDLLHDPDTTLELQHEGEYLRIQLKTFARYHQVCRPIHLPTITTDIHPSLNTMITRSYQRFQTSAVNDTAT